MNANGAAMMTGGGFASTPPVPGGGGGILDIVEALFEAATGLKPQLKFPALKPGPWALGWLGPQFLGGFVDNSVYGLPPDLTFDDLLNSAVNVDDALRVLNAFVGADVTAQRIRAQLQLTHWAALSTPQLEALLHQLTAPTGFPDADRLGKIAAVEFLLIQRLSQQVGALVTSGGGVPIFPWQIGLNPQDGGGGLVNVKPVCNYPPKPEPPR